jgi:hypothetical protein
MTWTAQDTAAYQAVFGEFAFEVNQVKRRGVPWEDWAITTRLDTRADASTVWKAVQCHQSQLLSMRERFDAMSAVEHTRLWGTRALYRVFSLVNGGSQLETDLFEGLRA